MIKHKFKISSFLIFHIFLFQILVTAQSEPQVKNVIDNVVTRLYKNLSENELSNLDDEKVRSLFTKEELVILATQHWIFDVNIPVIVSIMQDQSQQTVPFWLNENHFVKTDLVVKNEYSTYNVWQKEFPTGTIHLGINGFDKHRPHYFVSVKPQNKNDKLEFSNFYPENQYVTNLDVGSFTYHDWDELVLTEVPESLIGGKLLTTIRGRAREAHLINAFRKTEYASSEKPDQIILTWSGNPSTSQSIQWRTNTSINNGVVRYWVKGKNPNTEYFEQKAEVKIIEDRLLQNDRYVNHYTAVLLNLFSETIYNYKVGNVEKNIWSEVYEFKTASESAKPFSFVYLGDTHKSNAFGKIVNLAFNDNPDASFFSIGGDLVSTGLHRDEWDLLFNYSREVFRNRPLMPILGNHDSQDGLGSWMYQELFDLPKNGPSNLPLETTYSFEYQNSLFLMIDVTAPFQMNTKWIETQLKETKAKWKFVMMHFPPYSNDEKYPVIKKEWCSLFDKYHVDIVFSGHVHYYMRSKPMFNEKPVSSTSEGTIYVISISTNDNDRPREMEDYVEVQFGGEYLYQLISLDNNQLTFKAVNHEGKILDNFSITK
ncbi:MAG: metallophosphoesterase family protein [Ignavibacteriae bacterium]|nr:metallophosphoesterase family protein [Ignavibacteriota bacterium]